MSSTIPPNSPTDARHGLLSPILLVLILLGSAVVAFCVAHELHSVYLHRDPAAFLYEARAMLAGDKLYGPKLFETNPPLIIWISALPVILSNLLHSPIILMAKLCVVALLALVTWWCHSLIRRSGTSLSTAQRLLLSLAIPLTVLLTQPDCFAQREQILVLLFLPYLVAASAGIASISLAERILLGVLAGIAVSLKPFHLITLIAVELCVLLGRRSLRSLIRAELITLVLTGLAFIAAVRLFTPQYFTVAVPLLDKTYWGMADASLKTVLFSTATQLEILLLCGWVAWALLRRRLSVPLVSATLFAAGTGAVLAFALQRTDWPYHEYPACIFAYLGIACLAIDLLTALTPTAQPLLRPSWRKPLFWAITCLGVLIASGLVIKYLRYIRRNEAPMSVGILFAGYPPGTTVFELSPGIAVYDVILHHHLHWAGRYVCLWTLPAIVRNEAGPRDPDLPFKLLPAETVASLAASLRHNITEDLATQRPQVVAVSQCSGESHCQGLDRDLNIVEWFSADPQFAAEWAHYQRQGTIPDFDVYVRTR